MQSGVGRTASPPHPREVPTRNIRRSLHTTKARRAGPCLPSISIRRLRLETKELLARRVTETASWGSHTRKPKYRDRAGRTEAQTCRRRTRRESSLRLSRPIRNPHIIHLSTATHIMKNARPEAVLQARDEKMTLRPSAASIGSKTHAIDAGPTRLLREKPHLGRRNNVLTRHTRIPKVVASAPVSM